MDKLTAFLFHLHKYEIGSADILVGSALVTDLQRLARNPIILSFLIYAECSALP